MAKEGFNLLVYEKRLFLRYVREKRLFIHINGDVYNFRGSLDMSYNNPDTEKEMRSKFIALMDKHGFKINIHGCGCCGSPAVKVEYNGKLIVCDKNDNELDEFIVEMIEDNQS